MRLSARYLIGAALLSGAVLAIDDGAARAEEAANPFTGLDALTQDGLSALHGRQGVSLNVVTNLLKGTQSFDIESSNNTVEAGSMHSGLVGLNNSFNEARGVNNIAVNTGIGANVQNGLIFLINMY